VTTPIDNLPDDLGSLKRLLAAEHAARVDAEAKAASAEAAAARATANVSGAEALIAHLKFAIEKMRRELYGSRSERGRKLVDQQVLDQMELELEDLEAAAAEDELAAEMAVAKDRRRDDLGFRACPPQASAQAVPRASSARARDCSCTGRLRGLRLDQTFQARRRCHRDTRGHPPGMESDPARPREVTCRACEKISQAPAPFHVLPRGFAGPSLLAMILFEKYGQHQPLNRQSERYAREGVDLSLSTLADQVGACATALRPLHALIEAHVLGAERLHGDDTTVPILAKGKTETGRVWVYVRDDKPFGGAAPPAALFYASRDRTREHPERHLAQFAGLLQADAYDGYNRLYLPNREPGPITEALCWSHARRKFFELADIAANARRGKDAPPISPIAFEAVKPIDMLFDIEREINGLPAEQRLAAREKRSAPLVDALEEWMRAERVRLSRHASVAKAIDYMLKRWPAFTGFLCDGRICMSNNAAERALRGLALGRKSWLFVGSERGAERAAVMYTLIQTAKLNDVDPQAWLADVLRRINDQPVSKLDELLPWNWRKHSADQAVAA
jgi:transposase